MNVQLIDKLNTQLDSLVFDRQLILRGDKDKYKLLTCEINAIKKRIKYQKNIEREREYHLNYYHMHKDLNKSSSCSSSTCSIGSN